LCCFLSPHFVGCWNYSVIPLSQPPKRQLPRTLYEIWVGICWKIIEENST